MLRAALIGCGKIGSEFADDPNIADVYTHAGAWQACPGVELVAVCDADAGRAHRCAKRWNVEKWFTDSGEMLNSIRPELVSVCTPDSTHHAMISAALETQGVRAILAEKPLARTLSEAQQLAGHASKLGIALAVNYSRRYAAGHRAIAHKLQGGLIGTIRQVRGCYTKGTTHNGTHWFDWARMLVGEISSVQGFDMLHEEGDDATLDVRLEFTNGAVGYLSALDHRNYSLFEIDILGTVGRVRIFDSGHRCQIDLAGESPYYSGYRTLLPGDVIDGGMRDTLLHAATDLVEALRAGRPPTCPATDAVRALAIADAAQRSVALGGTPILLPHVEV